jgi:hypothetical protein
MTIDHTGLSVSDCGASRDFFCPALGATLGIELIVEVRG